MKKICSYCGQDTYMVDYEYLVGNDHLSCALSAEEKTKQMQIIGWKKLAAERFDVLGATFYIADCNEDIEKYIASIYEALTNQKLFNIKLSKAKDNFILEVEAEASELVNVIKVKKIIQKTELKSLNLFLNIMIKEMIAHQPTKSYIILIKEIQYHNRNTNKLKATSGNINFNMPSSHSIQW